MPDRQERQPNPALHKERAEGSRETVDSALGSAEHGREESRGSERPGEQRDQGPVGISGPVEEEERQQAELPPRGTRKGGAHA